MTSKCISLVTKFQFNFQLRQVSIEFVIQLGFQKWKEKNPVRGHVISTRWNTDYKGLYDIR